MNIIIRSFGGSLPEISTGHLYRSKIIAYLLKKKNNKLKIFFYITSNKSKKDILRILNFNNSKNVIVRTTKTNIKKEIYEILSIKPKLVIYDTLGTKVNIIKKLKSKNIKIVTFDDISSGQKFCDLTINAIMHINTSNHNIKNGYKYLIFDTTNHQVKKIKKIKKILLFFGGYDHRNLLRYTLKILIDIGYKANYTIVLKYFNIDKKNEIKLLVNNLKKITKSKIKIINGTNSFIKILKNQNFVICSGGLCMFQSLSLGLSVLSIPQYKHQLNSINKLYYLGLPLLNYKNLKISKIKISNYLKNIINNQQLRNNFLFKGPKILNYKSNDRAINLILKLLDK